MNPVEKARAKTYAALAAIPQVRLHRDAFQLVDPPAGGCGAAMGPARLEFNGAGPEPTDAVFQVAVVAPKNAQAITTLERMTPIVAAALHEVEDAVVGRAVPGTWGSTDLPCHLIDLRFAL